VGRTTERVKTDRLRAHDRREGRRNAPAADANRHVQRVTGGKRVLALAGERDPVDVPRPFCDPDGSGRTGFSAVRQQRRRDRDQQGMVAGGRSDSRRPPRQPPARKEPEGPFRRRPRSGHGRSLWSGRVWRAIATCDRYVPGPRTVIGKPGPAGPSDWQRFQAGFTHGPTDRTPACHSPVHRSSVLHNSSSDRQRCSGGSPLRPDRNGMRLRLLSSPF